jgi:hypothetical protein
MVGSCDSIEACVCGSGGDLFGALVPIAVGGRQRTTLVKQDLLESQVDRPTRV